ncbi:MAG TPA: sigma-70 family RNA polymerase sigma factor [Bacteroidia bacterium]|nr:sigma-70 family RNA polymerase sigma factor [Bacteroidia bacterium]
METQSDTDKSVKQLYEKYAQKLLIYATHTWSLEKDTAWDLIYKTIYKATEVSGQYEFQDEQKFASFLFKIFINQIRDHLRQVKVLPKAIENAELNDHIINNLHSGNGADTNNSSPALKILEAELAKLEDWQRILLLLRSQDMPYNEISRFVDKPEKQLKVYYARLKQQLTDRITQQLNKK